MGNLPPGVSPGTRDAPWNEEPAPNCGECGGVYAEGGHETVTVEVDAEGNFKEKPCPNAGMDRRDYDETQLAHKQEQKMEERRLQEMEQKMDERMEGGI